jgi:hypothetical protein
MPLPDRKGEVFPEQLFLLEDLIHETSQVDVFRSDA